MQTLTAVVLDRRANPIPGAPVNWISTNTAVASVSAAGTTATVTAVSPGSATITVASVAGTATAAIPVTVAADLRSVTVSPSSVSLDLAQNRSRQVTATAAADQGVNATYTWTTANPTVATVSPATGPSTTITSVGSGSTTVTVRGTSQFGIQRTADVAVQVAGAVRGVTVTPRTASVPVGTTLVLAAAVDADVGVPSGVTWSSSAANVASVSPSGVVTGVAAGTARIIASSVASSAVRDSATITVTPVAGRGLIAHYPLDGNGTDQSGNGNHGVVRGATAAPGRTGQSGTALLFAQSGEVTVPTNNLLRSLTGDLSLVFWMRRGANAIAAQMIPVSRRLGVLQHFVTYIVPEGVGLQCCSSASDPTGMFFNPAGTLATLNDGGWHQVAITRRYGAGGFTQLYLDGNPVGGSYTAGSATAVAPVMDAPLLIGRQDSPSPGQYEGYLDDLYIYDTILTQTDIRALGASSSGLVAHYPFDGSANDVTSSPINGTLTNASYAPGRVSAGQALQVQGGASFMQAPISSGSKLSFRTTDTYTVTLWMRPDQLPTGPSNAIAYAMGRNDFSSSIQLQPNGTVFVGNCTPTEFCFSAFGTNSATPGQWTHVAQLYDGVNRTLTTYVNGVRGGTVSLSLSSRAIDQAFNVGGTPLDPSNGFRGRIDDVRVYRVLLTPAEIAALVNVP